MEIFQTIWKFFRHSGNFPDNLVTCQKVWKLSKPSIIFRLYLQFSDKTEAFQTIRKCSIQYENFPDNPETFQKLQLFFRQVLDIIYKRMISAKTFWKRKTFRGVMLHRFLRISVSAYNICIFFYRDFSYEKKSLEFL